MPISCAARGCLSQQGILTENGQKISFHRFPKDDVKQKWLRNMRQDDWTPSKFSRLCSLHFELCCYRGGSDKKILHSYAVPTIFTNQATVPEKIPIKRRIIMKTPSTASTSAVHEFKESVKPIKRKVSEGPCSNTTNAAIASTSATPFVSPCADTSEVNKKKIKLSEEPRTKTPSFALASTSATSCTAKSEVARQYIKEKVPGTSDVNYLKKQLAHYKVLAERRGRKLKNLQKKQQRIAKKVDNLESIIKDLNSKLETEQFKMLQDSMSSDNKILSRYIMKSQGFSLPKEYPKEIKQFALTLQFLSGNDTNL